MPDIAFKKMKDCYKPQRTQDYMLFPIYLSMGTKTELVMCIQVMAKRKKFNANFFAGFSQFDETFLALCGNLLQIKVHQIIALHDMK